MLIAQIKRDQTWINQLTFTKTLLLLMVLLVPNAHTTEECGTINHYCCSATAKGGIFYFFFFLLSFKWNVKGRCFSPSCTALFSYLCPQHLFSLLFYYYYLCRIVPLEILSSPLLQIQLVLVSLVCHFVILWYKLAVGYNIAFMHQLIYITIKEYCHCSVAMEHKT